LNGVSSLVNDEQAGRLRAEIDQRVGLGMVMKVLESDRRGFAGSDDIGEDGGGVFVGEVQEGILEILLELMLWEMIPLGV